MTTDRRIASVNEFLAATLLAGVALTWALAARHATPEGLAWTLDRLAGVAAYTLLSLSAGLGAVLKSRFVPSWLARPLQYGWHGLMSSFGLALTAVHVAFVTVDHQQPQTLADVLIPGHASYRPLALALGTLALYAALAVYLSFSARTNLPRPLWRGLHLLAYPAWLLATVHAWLAGTDQLTLLYLAGTAVVVGGAALRLFEARRSPQPSAR